MAAGMTLPGALSHQVAAVFLGKKVVQMDRQATGREVGVLFLGNDWTEALTTSNFKTSKDGC